MSDPRNRRSAALVAAAVALAAGVPARTMAESSGESHAAAEPSDLGLSNFFARGWNEPWVERHSATPDMALLRVEPAFLYTQFRVDFVRSVFRNDPVFSGSTQAKASLSYALNRRIQLTVSGTYVWDTIPGQPSPNGAGASIYALVQLVDNPFMAYAFQAEVETPNQGIGEAQTALVFSLAGWQDVARWIPALGPVGLYYSLKWETLTGPSEPGEARNGLTWDVSVARTWTPSSTPVFGNLTTFLEATMSMPLGGDDAGKVTFSLTPGLRFSILEEHAILLGVDLPVSHDPPYSATWRATYLLEL